jgi:hypothetical protein
MFITKMNYTTTLVVQEEFKQDGQDEQDRNEDFTGMEEIWGIENRFIPSISLIPANFYGQSSINRYRR